MSEIWDAVAPTYAEDAWQWAAYSDEALRLLAPERDHRVLDLACGPGTLSFALAKRVARVDAVDYSAGMIAELVSRAERDRIANVNAQVMDAQALDFADATFDRAVCMFAFFFFPDRARAFAELHRVVRPGGKLLIATWAPIERRPIMRLGFEAMAEALPHLPRPSKGDLQAPEDCIRETSSAGFVDVRAHSFESSVRVKSPADYLALLVRSAAPIAAMKKKLEPSVWAETERRLLGALEKRIPENGAELSAECIFTEAARPHASGMSRP